MTEAHVSAAFETIQSNVVCATLELFEAYEAPVVHLSVGEEIPFAPTRDDLAASIIGYANESVRGALTLVASPSAARAWPPGLPDDARHEEVCDVVGEFSNMLLGRLKNRLLSRGLVLLLATPTTAFGRDLRLPSPAAGASSWLVFEGAAGRVYVRVDATIDASFTLDDAPAEPAPPPAAEGDMMFF